MTDDASPVTVRNLVLVDADLGNVALSFSEIEDAKNRIVCNAESEPKLVPCTALEAELKEGDDPTAAAPEAALAYTLTGDLYDFYKDHFGRDSIDGGGMPLISTVSYCEEEECPFENAFWDGEQMVYGDGLVTDDVTGHELTHGVNGSESHLFYYYQSGALDEAIADVFGELFDLSTPSFPTAGDKPADRWKIGEDSSIGTIRNMSDPPAFGQPDRTGSEEWFYEPDADLASGDNGGVHENSGVGGKAAFLITDGASFNGQTISGLGIEKALQIHYDAITNLLTSASDYQDYGNALRQACSDLVGEHEITATDCEQVEKTVQATEMETPPPSAAPARASACAGGQTPDLAFSDDLENPGSGNWAAGSLLFEHPERLLLPAGAEHGRARRDLCQQRDDEHLGRRRELGDGLRDRDDEKRHRPERRVHAVRPRAQLRVRRRQQLRRRRHRIQHRRRRSLDGRREPDRGRRPLRGPDLHRRRQPAERQAGVRRREHRLRLDPAESLLAGRPADPVPLPDRHRRSAERLRLVHRRHRDLQLRAGRLHSPASAAAAAGRNRERGSRAVAGPGRRQRLRRRPRRPGQGAGEAGEGAAAPADTESAERRRPQGNPQGRGRRAGRSAAPRAGPARPRGG